MKTMLATLAIVLPLLAAAADNPDAKFYKNAAEGGIAEVELGNLAESKTDNGSVKSFALMMVADHSAANEKLAAIAGSKNMKLPTTPSVTQEATKAKLKVLSGRTFDESYIKAMLKDHEDTIAMFKREIAQGQDPDAKAFATATLPTLQAHLKNIQSIAAQAGVDGK